MEAVEPHIPARCPVIRQKRWGGISLRQDSAALKLCKSRSAPYADTLLTFRNKADIFGTDNADQRLGKAGQWIRHVFSVHPVFGGDIQRVDRTVERGSRD